MSIDAQNSSVYWQIAIYCQTYHLGFMRSKAASRSESLVYAFFISFLTLKDELPPRLTNSRSDNMTLNSADWDVGRRRHPLFAGAVSVPLDSSHILRHTFYDDLDWFTADLLELHTASKVFLIAVGTMIAGIVVRTSPPLHSWTPLWATAIVKSWCCFPGKRTTTEGSRMIFDCASIRRLING